MHKAEKTKVWWCKKSQTGCEGEEEQFAEIKE